MKRTIILVFLIGCIYSLCNAQFYSTGEAPSSVRWERIRTRHFNIIFPSEIRDEANQLACNLEFQKPLTEEGLNHVVRKFPVILYNTSVLSNGYVTRAPKRMELVTTPPQDSYSQSWLSQLTLHEYRHAVQTDKLNQGFTKALSFITGEIATGGVAALVPAWFYEGDAVYNETVLSRSGRGRIPGFNMPLRTILLQNEKLYPYNKAIFGSYRDFVPNPYQYGYQMIQYGYNRFGNEIWANALDYTARNPFFIWPLAFYLKKNHGIYKSALYRQSMESLKVMYDRQEDTISYFNYLSKTKRTDKTFTSYKLPKDLGNGNYLALKTGMDNTDVYVIIDSSGKEEKLLTTGYNMGLRSGLYGNRLIWDEIVSDPRWPRRDFSEIVTYDLNTHKRQNLTKRTRYFSPDFSPDGKQIAVAETDLQNHHYITILDAYSGNKIKRIPSPENKEIQFPTFISESEILVITVSDSGKQFEVCHTQDSRWQVLIEHTWFDVSEPVNYKNYILFRSSYKGIENIFAINKLNSAIYQLTYSRFGAYHPSVSADCEYLVFSNYTLNGFDIATLRMDTTRWERVAVPDGFTYAQKEKTGHEVHQNLESGSTAGDTIYKAKPYRKAQHLINIHSWVPFYTDLEDATDDPVNMQIYPGIMLFSQNLLSTLTSSISYRFDKGSGEIHPSFTWRGWYPVIELSGKFRRETRTLQIPEGIVLPDKARNYYEINLTTYLPLLYDRGNHITILKPMVEYQRTNTWYYEDNMLKSGIDFLHYKLYFALYSRTSKRDIYPKLGQFLTVTFTQTPTDLRQFGNLFSIQEGILVPGFAPHHHIFIRGGIQRQNPGYYFLSLNRLNFPRGYIPEISGEFNNLLVDYAFPAGYPDLSLGPLLYIKRFRVNLFHDLSYGKDILQINGSDVKWYTGSYQSFGAEIYADMHVIRFIFPISVGVRAGYMPGRRKIFSELLLSVETGIF
jgi:hypothetical protein